MRIFTAGLVLVATAFLWLLPITSAVYDYRTDLREDTFTSALAAGITTANHTLTKPIFENDLGTITITSDLTGDTPALLSYNTSSRLIRISGLTANATRILNVSYDVDALAGNDAIATVASRVVFIWLLSLIIFPVAALAAIFLGRV